MRRAAQLPLWAWDGGEWLHTALLACSPAAGAAPALPTRATVQVFA